ncbi:5-(carboxyamino)imidazole ribonucleotide synthase [bacterium]|nr:5-(carboxyamino)imidazole ribonucleotide synthase [bacterium]
MNGEDQKRKSILPGATVGVLGGGQLGRMFAQVAKRAGYQVVVYTDTPGGPASQVTDRCFVGDYGDTELLSQFREQCDVATYEFENIPVETFQFLQEEIPVRPDPRAIYETQNRLRERALLTGLHIPIAPFSPLTDREELDRVREERTFPVVMKTAESGYDGKGQRVVECAEGMEQAWEDLRRVPCVVEEKIDFDREFSILVARSSFPSEGGDPEACAYPPIENTHESHILAFSSCPMSISANSQEMATSYALAIAEELQVEGVIAIEFFLGRQGEVLVNEIAPRPHNSGHLTIEAFYTSQFEQQLRGVCALPLGSVEQREPAVMRNLLGDVVQRAGEQGLSSLFRDPQCFLHLYGKAEPKPGRKIGHITALGSELTELEAHLRKIFIKG